MAHHTKKVEPKEAAQNKRFYLFIYKKPTTRIQ